MNTLVTIHQGNFGSQGWATEQVLRGADPPTPNSPYVRLHCPPIPNNASPSDGAVGMQLVDQLQVIRRVRLNNNRQDNLLREISMLRYSTLVIPITDTTNRPALAPGLVLVIKKRDEGDDDSEPPVNIFFDPTVQTQPVLVNEWQEWDTLQGNWQEFGNPNGPFPLADFIQRHPSAKLHNAKEEGKAERQPAVRFTIGGPNQDYALFFHYVDRFMINREDQPAVILIYDFECGTP